MSEAAESQLKSQATLSPSEQLSKSLFSLQLKYPDDPDIEQSAQQLLAFMDSHYKLQKSHLEVSLRLSKTLSEFSDILTKHKNDREQLLLISRERQTLMERISRYAQSSLLMLRENEVLESTVAKLQQISRNLTEKVGVLETSLKKEQQFGRSLSERLQNTYGDTEITRQYNKMVKEYCLLMSQNNEIQEQIHELSLASSSQHDSVKLFVLLLALTAQYLPDVLLEMVRSKVQPYCSSLRALSKAEVNQQLCQYFPHHDKESLSILTEDLKDQPFVEW